uniref:Uncharacterized protein n=1 Tax=Acrobeloides nanus TaxID=290746 RepID=A0A914E9P4_9BILA
MLARFSVADGLNDGKKYRLCIKFIEDHSTQVLVHKMENGVLQNMFDNQQADRLNCLPYDEKHKISIFLKSTFSGGDKNNRYPAGFSYVIEKVEEKEDYASTFFVLR